MIYWLIVFRQPKCSEMYRVHIGVRGGLAEPPGGRYGPKRRKHTSPHGAGAPPLGRRPNWRRFGGCGPPFVLSYSSFPSSPTPTREGRNPTPGGSRTPPGRTIGAGPLPRPLHSFIYGGRGHPIDTQLDPRDRFLSRVRCPLHNNPPWSYRSGA